MNQDEMKRIQFEKRFEYQIQLVGRRWQYFATYLLLTGLSLAAISETPAAAETKTSSTSIFHIFPALGVLAGIIFSNLVSIATKRVDKVELKIPRKYSITDVALDGKFFGLSETILLYSAIYLIIAVHVVHLFSLGAWFGFGSIALAIVNLFFLTWRAALDTREAE